MKRRLFTLAAGVSLLLCIATVGLWVRSYWRADTIGYVSYDNSRPGGPVRGWWRMYSNFGEFAFTIEFHESPAVLQEPGWHYDSRSARREWTWGSEYAGYLGFGFRSYDAVGYSSRDVWFPHWFIALLAAAIPAFRLRALLRARRAGRVGLCPMCGYDLRATPDRCPECGTVAAATTRRSGEPPSRHATGAGGRR